MRLIARTAAGLLLAGSLAACFPAEETPALITAEPNPAIVDLPPNSLGVRTVVITFRNLGPGDIGPGQLTVETNTFLHPDETKIEAVNSVEHCDDNLPVNGTCTIEVTVMGSEPDFPYEISVGLKPAFGPTVAVPILIV